MGKALAFHGPLTRDQTLIVERDGMAALADIRFNNSGKSGPALAKEEQVYLQQRNAGHTPEQALNLARQHGAVVTGQALTAADAHASAAAAAARKARDPRTRDNPHRHIGD